MLTLELGLEEIGKAIGCETALAGAVREICTDTRALRPGCLFVALEGERFDGHDYVAQALAGGAACAVIHHDCDIGGAAQTRLLRVQDTQQAMIDLGGLYRSKFDLRCVGITGSVGKTTTKDMIAAVAAAGFPTLKTEGNLNNEIGMPKTLFRLDPSIQVAVLEMGMQHLGEIAALAKAARPTLGVITNIGVSHLEQLGSREAILRAKLELADALPDGALLLLCGDNDLLRSVQIPRLNVRFYGIENPLWALEATKLREADGHTTFTITEDGKKHGIVDIPCIGRHNVCNALAAFGVGRALGMDPALCIRALADYEPTGRRQRIVHWQGITVVEDCYNASPDSMYAALTTLETYPKAEKRIAVLADMLELGTIAEEAHREVGAFAAAHGADLLLAYGPLAAGYCEGAAKGGLEAMGFLELEPLLAELKKRLVPGSVVWVKGSNGMHLEKLLEALYQTKEKEPLFYVNSD